MNPKKSLTLEEIKAEKERIRSEYHRLQKEIIADTFNPTNLIIGLATGLGGRLLSGGKPASGRKKGLLSFTDKGKINYIDTVSNILGNPLVSSFLTRTRKSWIQWQLFNIGLLLAKKGYTYYKNRKEKRKAEANIAASISKKARKLKTSLLKK